MDTRRLCRYAMGIALLLVMAVTVAACAGGERSLSQLEQPLDGGGDPSAGEDRGLRESVRGNRAQASVRRGQRLAGLVPERAQ